MIKRIASGLVVAALIVAAGLVANMLPLRAEYAQQATFGGTSTCSGNAETVNLGAGNVASYSDLEGVTISWIVGSGCTNTGPSTLALTGVSGGPYNIYRRNGGALIQLGGYEMQAGDLVKATYDGTQFELDTDYTGGDPVGTIKVIDYSTADPGYALLYGECISETANPALYAKIGTIHNSADGCTGSNFGLSDLRGGLPAGLDNMGGTAANRITSAVSGVTGTTLGASGGSQGYASGIGKTYLQNFSLTVTNNLTYGTGNITAQAASGAGGQAFWDGGPSGAFAVTGSLGVTSGGSGTAFPTLPYVQIVGYEIKL